ncbi:hypothetical protein B0H10DRAFT_1950554 [Mycena sp. CBHHK59/15]|nr:hypothetical protein B0H10DRAFT_1950554 [Mycena sp. CBHHK59/15]
MMLPFLAWIGLAAIGLAHAQTLLFVSPLQTDAATISEDTTLSISAIGVSSDGMTTYVEVGAETKAVQYASDFTRTLLSTPVSYTATFVEDASRFEIGGSSSGLAQTCVFGADGQGTCVYEFREPLTTIISTYSGPVDPWYTLNAAASPSLTGTAITPSGSQAAVTAAASSLTGTTKPSGSQAVVTQKPNGALAERSTTWAWHNEFIRRQCTERSTTFKNKPIMFKAHRSPPIRKA